MGKLQAPLLRARIDVDREELRASYAGALVYDMVEKDLIRLLERRDSLSWRRQVRDAVAHRVKVWLSTVRTRSSSVRERLGQRVLFVVSIENNLNSMLPAARALEAQGVECSFLTHRKLIEGLAGSRKAVEDCDFIALEEIRPVHSTSARVALQAWDEDVRTILKTLKASGYRWVERLGFSIAARRLAAGYLAMIDAAAAVFTEAPPLAVVAPRPKGRTAIAPVMAARSVGIETIFLSHTTWFRELGDLFTLYDLSCFDAAVVYSNRCASDVRRRNETIEVMVSGWPQMRREQNFYKGSESDRLVVGYPCSRQYGFLADLAEAVAQVGAQLFVKGHPPGDDANELFRSVDRADDVQVWAHNEISLYDFLRKVDILVCGKSNVGVEAASLGIPLVSFYSELEEAVTQVRWRSAESRDVAIWSVSNPRELKELLSTLVGQPKGVIQAHARRQAEACEAIFPVYDPSAVADFIVRRGARVRGTAAPGS